MHCNNGAGDEVFAPKTTADAVEGLESRIAECIQGTTGDFVTADALSNALGSKADVNHSHPAASSTAAGFMAAEDKAKLDRMPQQFLSEQQVQQIVQQALLALHPVGSLYFTVGEEIPAELFGGEWVKLDGKFIRAVTSGAGETGGSNTRTLTVANLPNQKGQITFHGATNGTNVQRTSNGVFSDIMQNTSSWRDGGTLKTGNKSSGRIEYNNGGQSAPFSIVPEHICVYAWKRVS